MFDNQVKISKLKNKLITELLPLIDDDYALLDAPNHNNIGDSLIYEGELAFMKSCPHRKLYSANIKYFRLSHLPQKGIILFHGGGNFGDLWPQFQGFRRRIIKERRQQKIIIFPQTVFYENEENLMADAALFNEHPNLTICVRDQRSYELLNKYFYKNTILLLPDMAFCLDLQPYHQDCVTNKTLLLKRVDKEVKVEVENECIIKEQEVETFDWPGIELDAKGKRRKKRKERINKHSTRLLRFLNLPGVSVDLNFGVTQLYNSHQQMLLGIGFINQYDTIYSTRLHGAILSVLLNKPVHILDNSYGKNSAFYNCWLSDFAHCTVAS